MASYHHSIFVYQFNVFRGEIPITWGREYSKLCSIPRRLISWWTPRLWSICCAWIWAFTMLFMALGWLSESREGSTWKESHSDPDDWNISIFKCSTALEGEGMTTVALESGWARTTEPISVHKVGELPRHHSMKAIKPYRTRITCEYHSISVLVSNSCNSPHCRDNSF